VNIRPLDDRLVVKPLASEETTPGGIVLPDTAQEKPQTGEVISVGPGKLLKNGDRAPLCVAVGNHVFYGKYSGTEVKVDGVEFKILREADVLAKLG